MQITIKGCPSLTLCHSLNRPWWMGSEGHLGIQLLYPLLALSWSKHRLKSSRCSPATWPSPPTCPTRSSSSFTPWSATSSAWNSGLSDRRCCKNAGKAVICEKFYQHVGVFVLAKVSEVNAMSLEAFDVLAQRQRSRFTPLTVAFSAVTKLRSLKFWCDLSS